VTNKNEKPRAIAVEEAVPEKFPKVDPILFEQYKIMVDTTSDVTKNRQNTNTFYLTVNTFILGAVSLVQNIPKMGIPLLSLTGVIMSALWYANINSFRSLNHAKFSVIKEIEASLPAQLFIKEEIEYNKRKHKGLTTVEKCIPLAFGLIYLIILLYNVYQILV
jgi:hypothetical protein